LRCGNITYNLRLPGQYYDQETGLFYNGRRDYDPQVGRYIESDPIGLRGGNNTYLYGLANPLTNTNASGLLVRGNGLSNQQWAEMQQAEARIRKVTGRACTCNSDGSSGSCIPCNIIPDLLDYLDRSVVHYKPVLPGACAQAPNVYPYMTLAEIAFDLDKCGCLASTIYHELLHNIRWNHTVDPTRDPVNAAEAKCAGELCGGGAVPTTIIN